MKNEIIELLDGMNDEQLRHVLDYVTNEYDEEGFEGHALDMLQRARASITLLNLKGKLKNRADFPASSMAIVEEECNNILGK